MPPNNEENSDWKELIVQLAIDYAMPVAGEVISGLIKNHFNPEQNNMELMFRNAIEEVCQRINEIVEDNFLKQYLADCSHISNQLYIYGQTQDKNVIENVQIESSRLAMRLSDLGKKATGGFFLASNMHLISLRSLSVIDSSYTGTLEEFRSKYFETGNKLISDLNNTGQSLEPGECLLVKGFFNTSQYTELGTRHRILTGEELPADTSVEGVIVSLNYRNQNKTFNTDTDSPVILAIDSEVIESVKGACESFRNQFRKDSVQPIYDIVEKTTAVATKWNEWEV
ncbi:hypothetical protein [Lysinibacillus fusiformis]|uniref:Uncharacterized protein n=1 Tax=Lysinibacillus fusiformis TaxID=28031 RepID=A0A1E4R4V5_9BACI|nr:hypothetical protein [Lysinibacillus fusiformis]ODV55479.1 hypothetical protein BG258_05970 [Lysinibacillus fusiformis]